MAVTAPEAAPHKRASMILVPTDTPGFRLVRNIPVMGDAGSGLRQPRRGRASKAAACPRRPASAPRARASRSPRSGSARAHPPLHALDRHLRARLRHDLRARGAARAGARACAWPASRSCSTGSPRAAPRSTPRACSCCGRRSGSTREGAKAARADVSLIKFFVAGVLDRVLDRAIQVHGALGITEDTVLVLLVPPRARRPHLRRPRRGPQVRAGPARPAALRRGRGDLMEGGGDHAALVDRAARGPARRGARRRRPWPRTSAARLPELTGALAVEQFPRGYSNLTYLVREGRPRARAAPAALGAPPSRPRTTWAASTASCPPWPPSTRRRRARSRTATTRPCSARRST